MQQALMKLVFLDPFLRCPSPGAPGMGLLGNCFWREGFETAFGPERRGEKGGYVLGKF